MIDGVLHPHFIKDHIKHSAKKINLPLARGTFDWEDYSNEILENISIDFSGSNRILFPMQKTKSNLISVELNSYKTKI
jgi:hypothetical protein